MEETETVVDCTPQQRAEEVTTIITCNHLKGNSIPKSKYYLYDGINGDQLDSLKLSEESKNKISLYYKIYPRRYYYNTNWYINRYFF